MLKLLLSIFLALSLSLSLSLSDVSFSFKSRLFTGHVQQGNEQSPISHKAKRRKVQEDKQGKIEKLGRIEGTAEKLGGEREQNRYIVGSILRLNLYFPESILYKFLETAIGIDTVRNRVVRRTVAIVIGCTDRSPLYI